MEYKKNSDNHKSIDVWYLFHSGFAVELDNTFLIFDYFINDPCEGKKPCLASGVINPDELTGKKVLVFSSHKHPDHFNPVILSWKEKLPDIEYFLSSDIPKRYHSDGMHILKPYQIYESNGLRVETFKSTDTGVAFLVSLEGISIYHAGDLNWWHWEEESKAWNNDMAAKFKYELGLLKEHQIDIAFLTADPRQEAQVLLGMNAFLSEIPVKAAFPMHFAEDFSVMEQLKKESAANPVFHNVKLISVRGEHFTVFL